MQRVYPSLPYNLPSSNQSKDQNGRTLLSLPTELLQAVIGEMVSAFGIYQAIKLRLISKWFNELLLDVIYKGPYIKLAVLQREKQRIIPPPFLAGFLIARYEKYNQFNGSLMNIIARSALRLEEDDGVLLNHDIRARRIAALCHAVSRNLHHEEIIRLGDSSDAYYSLWDSHDENYGALIAAASTGDLSSTQDFFEKVKVCTCTSTRAEDCFGTALIASTSSGQYHTTNLLLKSGANPNLVSRTPPAYLTALKAACEAGNSQIATLLLSPSYKLIRSDDHYQRAVELAINGHHWDLAQYLIERSEVPHTTTLTTRLFFEAALAGNLPVLSSLLSSKAGADVKAGGKGDSALLLACKMGAFEIVRMLVEAGVDPDGWESRRSRRSVPVLTALKRGHYRVVDLLLVLGARSLRPGFQEAL
ncbi:hypothetical protein HYALB_00010555 [Hymenoscyphus albidus]|uniref:Ankyrin n=1 Tax=Hymenoscyphus albidus TaxID=595503 RepID=A0A9N9LLQ2_9HELO|nr:hypothetical protein HYALB_00010555 [Hymenoscyphus albidus]